jgi:geranylgeranyl diphosphate synthase type I
MTLQSRPDATSMVAFNEYKQAINGALESYFKRISSSLEIPLPPVAYQALKMMEIFTLQPGKRIRGALAALAYDDIVGQKCSKNGLALAVAMEIIQSYILILDDVTDKSELRRGAPTVHRLYQQLKDMPMNEHEANMLAMYVGIIAQHLATLAVLEIDESAEHVRAALSYLHNNIVITGFGQMDDLVQGLATSATREEILRKYTLKTSYYTFINPLQTGLALAGITDKRHYSEIIAFGSPAGVAFQIHDDYLGVFGRSEETGKPTVDDIREGKLTLLVQHALAHGSIEDATKLRGYLGSPKVDEAAMASVRAILDRSGATIEAQRETQAYAGMAQMNLVSVTIWSESLKGLLSDLVHYAVNRKS